MPEIMNENPRLKILNCSDSNSIYLYDEDFYRVRKKYFDSIITNENWNALPGGVQISFSPISSLLGEICVKTSKLPGYNLDDGTNLLPFKRSVSQLLTGIFEANLNLKNFTLTPSVSHSSFILNLVLKQTGIKDVYFDTPTYFAPFYQARDLGMNCNILLNSPKNGFQIDPKRVLNQLPKKKPFCIVLFQPKYGLGYNLDSDILGELLQNLGSNAHVIFDCAADRSYPCHIEKMVEQSKTKAQVFIIRGIFKGIGLNGAKVAVIKHPESFRENIKATCEIYAAAIDKFTIEYVLRLIDLGIYHRVLEETNKHVHSFVKFLRDSLDPNFYFVSNLENGYMGSLRVPIFPIGESLDAFRHCFFCSLSKHKIPAIPGSALLMPYDNSCEYLRINAFQPINELPKIVKGLNKVAKDLK